MLHPTTVYLYATFPVLVGTPFRADITEDKTLLGSEQLLSLLQADLPAFLLPGVGQGLHVVRDGRSDLLHSKSESSTKTDDRPLSLPQLVSCLRAFPWAGPLNSVCLISMWAN